MIKDISIQVSPDEAFYQPWLHQAIARSLSVTNEQLTGFRVRKRSIDARRGIRFSLLVTVAIDEKLTPEPDIVFDSKNVTNASSVIVVGSGPAGLFAALRLIELGYKPIVFERGKDVSSRKKDVALINRNIQFNNESNYCFGEGGAGTFSDGKLYTRSTKRGSVQRILELFVLHGANPEILIDAHSHIGSDKLPAIVANIRKTILDAGGEVHFESCMKELVIRNSKVCGIKLMEGTVAEGAAVILATGHSSPDVYESLHRQGVELQFKPFAMGVRVEHPQSLIDDIQYHKKLRGKYIPAASYALADQFHGRGAFSFCMCPGGFIVPASSSENQCVVNGMSPSLRNSPYANSGIVTEIRLSDLAGFESKGVLAGLAYQQELEENAFRNGGTGQIAPAQRLTDFVQGRLSSSLPKSSYFPGTVSSPMHFWLPPVIAKTLQLAFLQFDKKMRGFYSEEAQILGVESRTSSPVRIPRSETGEHILFSGLYPCGEGAGYSGGIVSSAIDGINAADAFYRNTTN
jgi:uncharacterized FAD-dependent dehydrogenase